MYAGDRIVELAGRVADAYTLPEDSWAQDQRGKTLCATCFKRRLDLYPTAIDVPLRQIPRGTSYDGVFQGGVGIMHERLREFLESHMRDYVMGRCLSWEDGTILPEYRSIYFRNVITLRGDEDTQYYICRCCGTIGVVPEAPYVLRRELPDAAVFQDRIACLYLGEDLARKLPWRQFPDVKACVIPVRNELLPDDELPAYERAIEVLTAAFDGDWPAAFTAVEEEARRIRMPDGTQTMGVVVRGIKLIVTGWASSGVMRVSAMRTE